MPERFRLDHADAAILAIGPALASLETGVIVQIACPPEGRFIAALDKIESDWIAFLAPVWLGAA